MSRVLTRTDYERIEQLCAVTDPEDYAVVTSRQRGLLVRSIHVFARQPMTKELTEYENTSSKVKFRGNKAEVEGSQLLAAKHLYDHLILRAYTVPVGSRKILGDVEVDKDGKVIRGKPLNREESITHVPVMLKREAVRDMVAQHWSAGQLIEMEGDDEEIRGETDPEEDVQTRSGAPSGDAEDALPREEARDRVPAERVVHGS